jgi:thymidylate synthase (FAD)
VRHRAGFAFSQESNHFIEYGEGARFSLPGVENSELAEDGLRAMIAALESYQLVVRELGGKKKERCGTARSLLPSGLESRLVFTGNLRALRHFCELRGAEDNVVEIRDVAAQVTDLMRFEAPTVFDALRVEPGQDDGPSVRNVRPETRKV